MTVSSRRYAVKEMYATLQGEGYHTGRPAVFLRFAGCNLWSGLERDRATAVCRFCDTDFAGTDGARGGKYSAESLAETVRELWSAHEGSGSSPFTVLTGGEPLLQLDDTLIQALHARGFEIAIETNGTLPAPDDIDWICVSPKAEAEFLQRRGDELKVVWPQPGIDPGALESLPFDHFFLQPMDGPELERNTEIVRAYVGAHPRWKVSLQTHKILGIP